ncbi:TPA: ATP/GTP-binding protein [Elizabethkingia anophelis]
MHIQEFSVGNFKSFKDINTLSLMATKSVSAYKEVDESNLIKLPEREVRLMKTKAIYGANASGKSNIIKALTIFINIVKNSVINKSILREIDKFRFSTETENSPSYFQIIFWVENTRYRYGFEADEEMIFAEWLYHKPGGREENLFLREGLNVIEVNKTSFVEGDTLLNLFDVDKGDNDLYRANSLVLTTLSTFGMAKISNKVLKAISSINVISGLGTFDLMRNAESRLEDDKVREYILNILKFGDIGIKEINYFNYGDEDDKSNTKGKKSNNTLVYSIRPKYDELGEISGQGFLYFGDESEGTKKLFEIAPCIFEAFNEETPLIIDEFDARFHPLLTREIIKLFNTNHTKSPQLIFTTHDTNLLDNKLFRKDQIDFVEKDSFLSSHLYSLIEFKGIKNSKSFENDYIKGKFGAVPYLGDFSRLFELMNDGKED